MELYKILLHVSGISIVEILFYFYYIGPLETEIFTKEFNVLVKSVNKDFENNNYFLTFNQVYSDLYIYNETAEKAVIDSQNNALENMQSSVDGSIKENERYNNNLLKICVIYWVVFNFVTLLIYLLEYNLKKVFFEQNDEIKENKNPLTREISDNDIEMIRLTKRRSSSIDEEDISYINDVRQRYYRFLLWSKCCDNKTCKKICGKFIEYLALAGCIITFQYFFINDIVLKYRILALEEIKYLFYKQLFPILNSILFPKG